MSETPRTPKHPEVAPTPILDAAAFRALGMRLRTGPPLSPAEEALLGQEMAIRLERLRTLPERLATAAGLTVEELGAQLSAAVDAHADALRGLE